ncbi:MAG: mannitol dehydrogenase family protein [Ostreibacterium sp.]
MSLILDSQHSVSINRPNYDRTILKPRIVHIGFGAFARAHQAFVLDSLHRQGLGGDWGYWAVYLRSNNQENIQELMAQDFCYTVMTKDHSNEETTICGALLGATDRVTDGIDAVLKRLADRDTSIIALTVTEKGYCATVDGQLDVNNATIIHDLANPDEPQSSIGVIVAALAKRKAEGLEGLTVLSCDNLPHNGHRCRQVIIAFAALLDTELTDWINDKVTFPNTMVDRIVPATTAASLQLIEQALGGMKDNQGVICEPFLQWVIENNFSAEHPNWTAFPGVRFVTNVEPYEVMKLRLLNGTHSFLAYLGYLGSYETIADTMQDKHYRRAAKALMVQEQASTLLPITDFDVVDYTETLIRRFENQTLQHRTWQIAADGSQKLPQRLLQSAKQRLQQGQNISYIALGIAGWLIYVSGKDEGGQMIEVMDPYASLFFELAKQAKSECDYLEKMLAFEAVFPQDLAMQTAFREAITTAFLTLKKHGARVAVALLEETL